jgi:tripartite-type tricarboxylate transporter receptor subunit TctC
MNNPAISRSALLLLALSFCLMARAAAAQSIEAFYKGRTVTLLVSTAPGGRYDLNGRLIAAHLGNFLPGHPNIVVENLPGGGGLALGNRLFNSSPRDGSVIAVMEPGTAQVAVEGDPNARFDPLKMTWIGSMSSFADDADLLLVNASHSAKTVADLRQPGISAKLGAVSPGSTDLTFAILARDLLGLHVEAVRGYPGATPIFLAMQSGEVDGQIVNLSSVRTSQLALWNAGKMRPLVQFGRLTRLADVPDVPTARELVKDPQSLALLDFAEQPFFMALPVAAPPDVPADRVAALRTAFMEMTHDPAFLQAVRVGHFDLSPIDGAAVTKLIQGLSATPKEVIARFSKMVAATP